MSLPRKIRCVVDSIADHGERVYTVELAPEGPVPTFRPGQFLHLSVDDYDPSGFWPESRVFSIASSPRERSRIRICYSVKGRYTTKMEQVLQPGGKVWIKLPYGDFVIDEERDATLIAGGTGISAFTAFIDALTPGYPRAVTLLYGARTPALLLFQDRILSQAGQVPGFEVVLFCETSDGHVPDCPVASTRQPIRHIGLIELGLACRRGRWGAGEIFYLSGPPSMLRAMGAELQARGIDADRIRTDAWE